MSIPVSKDQVHRLIENILLGLREPTIQWFVENSSSLSESISVIQEILEELDRRWLLQEIPLTIIYIASKIIEEVIEGFRKEDESDDHQKGTIILGTMNEDYHSLGKSIVKRMLTPFFHVVDLGVDVSVSLFVSEAVKWDADIIAVSSLMMNSVVQIQDLRVAVDQTNWKKKPSIIVGGAPFTLDPELYKHVGADDFGITALEASRKCLKLMELKP